MTISSVNFRLDELFENKLEKRFMLEDLKSRVKLMGEPTEEKDNEKIIKDMKDIEKIILSFNEEIKDINENILKKLNIPKKIVLLNVENVSEIIKDKLGYVHKDATTIDLVNQKFKLELSHEIKKVRYSLEGINTFFRSREKFDGTKQIDKIYFKDINEAINIYSIGYGKTAVLCVGRAIEALINKFLDKLFEKNIIQKQDYDKKVNSDYNEKIGFLKGKFISEEEFSELNSFSFKRNKGGHPNLGEIDDERARTFIQQGIWLVIDLQKKIEETKSDGEVEEEKTRELLGGKAEWGGPMLYGTTKEKLEQLKGYSGKKIDEIREQLEIEMKEESNRDIQ